jgi:hypothetical protein
MRGGVALQRYLQRHMEAGLPDYPFAAARWQHVLVLPAYRESPELLQRMTSLPQGDGRTLVILVLNRPDSDDDPQANAAMRKALDADALRRDTRLSAPVVQLNTHTDLYLHDIETLCGPTPAARGVGLARKTGADLALRWMCAGVIGGDWLCSTDADATLPPDYFTQLDSAAPGAAAAVFPFRHVPDGEAACDAATALYELRLHQYVLGLEYAGSPYAYHTLGSCLAIRAGAYVQVRGFPRRAGGEDFYVLNKLAKVGAIARLHGHCIELQSRQSARVPFGTGPAVRAISEAAQPEEARLFYHPACFVALRAVLDSLAELAVAPERDIAQVLCERGLDASLASAALQSLEALGVTVALQHCRQHGRSAAQFQRQFHQWFDAFRTLKFIHAVRDSGWAQQSLHGLESYSPILWPVGAPPRSDIESLPDVIRRHWGWC